MTKNRIEKISREKEHSLPNFKSHAEAREYFKGIYGVNFQMEDSIEFDDTKIYIYKLIFDLEEYMKCVKEVSESKALVDDGTDTCLAYRFFNSFQTVQIHENGFVHVIH